MSEAHRPTGGGNTKYIVAGLLLLAGAGGLVAILTSSPTPPPPPPPPPQEPKQEVARVNPLAAQDLIIEEEPEEPEEPAVEEPEPEKPKKPRRAKAGSWDCAGDMDRGGLKKVMNSIRPQVRTCYERRLKVNTILQGDLRLKVKVGAGGKVEKTSVGGSLRDNEVFGCVRRLTKGLTFPAPTGGSCAVIDIPFQFSPKR